MFKINDVVLLSLLLTFDIFHTLFLVFLLFTLIMYLFAGKRENWYEIIKISFCSLHNGSETFFQFLKQETVIGVCYILKP